MKIAVVIVTYNPIESILLDLVETIKGCVNFVFIIDNCSHKRDGLANKLSKISFFTQLEENKGLAAAQNYGIEQAILHDTDLIFFFDQDSAVDEIFVQSMIADYKTLKKSTINLGVLGPRVFDVKDQHYYKPIKINRWGKRLALVNRSQHAPIETSLVISSGCLVETKVLKDVGRMNEAYFIDYIDTEWCLRAIHKGYRNFISQKAILKHNIGDDFISFVSLRIPMYSKNRIFFRIRNAYWLAKCTHTPLVLGVREIAKNIFYQLILVLNSRSKLDLLKILIKANFLGIVNNGDKND
ncbi:glycosyltransferase family 2 protein [Acinetobacter sp. MD2(2019)]|uniref:glycosyltransferase family 2 protein n=1 Tax=Acinetobacter sp. MD2(2019) TaxID=2605273 RepID=UPI002D1F3C49|nr:glycosyltransferase family 2 protein [Acinetobacter sp. MD2(2019)]MEB3754432.1 glycosyltransferase family 2 protein [Acinetobacter sp. MD2(2019)]